MKIRTKVLIFIALILAIFALTAAACSGKTSVTTAPSSFVPVVKNDSIVTAEIVRVQDGEGTIRWVLTIQVRSSEDVSGYPNYTKGKTGQTLIVRCMEDAAHLQTGQIITAHLRFEGDETRSFYFIWNIH